MKRVLELTANDGESEIKIKVSIQTGFMTAHECNEFTKRFQDKIHSALAEEFHVADIYLNK